MAKSKIIVKKTIISFISLTVITAFLGCFAQAKASEALPVTQKANYAIRSHQTIAGVLDMFTNNPKIASNSNILKTIKNKN